MNDAVEKILNGIEIVQKWAPVVQLLQGMFTSPDEAMEHIRQWEQSKREANDERLSALAKERGDQ